MSSPADVPDQVLFTHVINPFTPRAASHELAQKVTFQTIRNAMDHAAANGVGVEALGIVLHEDQGVVEPPVRAVPALSRTIMDFGTFSKKRLYPLFADVLQAAHDHGRGRYLIYSNIDISPQRHLYVELKRIIDAQRGAEPMYPFIVTRRSLIARPYSDVSELEDMYKDPGHWHPGFDLFVFPRVWVPQMRFAGVCIGAWWFDLMMMANLDAVSRKRVITYKKLSLTFHVGDDPTWLGMDEFAEYNRAECAKACSDLRAAIDYRPFASWLDWLEIKLTGKRPKFRRVLIEFRNARQKKLIGWRGGLNYF